MARELLTLEDRGRLLLWLDLDTGAPQYFSQDSFDRPVQGEAIGVNEVPEPEPDLSINVNGHLNLSASHGAHVSGPMNERASVSRDRNLQGTRLIPLGFNSWNVCWKKLQVVPDAATFFAHSHHGRSVPKSGRAAATCEPLCGDVRRISLRDEAYSVKCANDNADAVAACTECGRGICKNCLKSTAPVPARCPACASGCGIGADTLYAEYANQVRYLGSLRFSMLGVCIVAAVGLLAVRYTATVPAAVKAALPLAGGVLAFILGVFELVASRWYVKVAEGAQKLGGADSVFAGRPIRLWGSITILTLVTYVVIIGVWLVVWRG